MEDKKIYAGGGMNRGCITGASPTGRCGAAYYCPEPYGCCAACLKDDCNIRCGWMNMNEKGGKPNVS